ncbi:MULTISPECIES: maleylacetoacetate isomerase [Sediminimonas]|uniref:maleylacetoacetate isomerase n=1 Tax=Sediminimonas TaxID=659427 RepID=UPI000414D89F|nr:MULTISPECIES: maleylacetoacetate isomerase [Sediminimonas]MDR9486373.1 maleylacetoacetate isomerase [Sediminimonas sp.]
MMRLWGYFRSSSSYRCRIALNLKEIPYEAVPVNLRNGAQHGAAYHDVNPQGLVPAVVADDGTALHQSLAILEWLDETHPRPALLPDDPLERAKVRAFAQVIACEIHPLQNLRVLRHLSDQLGADEEKVRDWLCRWIGEGLAVCEETLARRGERAKFCFGDTPGLADVCLVPQMFSAARFGVDISRLSRLNEIHQRCEALPAFAAAHPARQPDYEE